MRDDVRYFPSNKNPTQTPSSASGANRDAESVSKPSTSTRGATTRVNAPQQEPLPQRGRGQADRSSNPRGQGAGSSDRSSSATRPPNAMSTPGTSGNRPTLNPAPNHQPNTGNQRQQAASAAEWASDHVSDAELICVSDETISQNVGLVNRAPQTSGAPPTQSCYNDASNGKDDGNSQPKQVGQHDSREVNNRKGAKRGNDGNIEVSDRQDSYADKASKYRWGKVENKRAKRNSSGDDTMLLGVKSTPHREIFVKHLDYSRCSKPADLEGRVKSYCRKRGIFILQARVFEQSDCNRANCRVSLKDEDVDAALSPDFWPEHAVARFWSEKPLNDAGGNELPYEL